MIQIEFNLNNSITKVNADLKDKFQDIITQYIENIYIDSNSVYFFVHNRQIHLEQTVEEHMNESDKNNKKLEVIVQKVIPKQIICPECFEPCLIKIKDYRIQLYGCCKGHIIEDLSYLEFNNLQKQILSKIICDTCKNNNKSNSLKNEFYICLTCNQNICLSCKSLHEKEHDIIEYDKNYYLCKKHKEPFTKYCKKCKINFCTLCETEHKEHYIISLNDINPNIDMQKEKLKEIKNNIDICNNYIKTIIEQLNKIISIMNLYHDINENILNNLDEQNKNYETLQNINEINLDNNIFKRISKINNIQNEDYINKIFDIIDFYKKMSLKKKDYEIYNNNFINKSIPITMKGMDIILNQMKKCICKITKENKETCLGCFTKFKYDNLLIPVLITSYEHLEDEKIVIEYFNNNEKLVKKIDLNNERKIYKIKNSNITIIEIIKDVDKINDFFEIDEEISNSNKIESNDRFELNSIYNEENIYYFQNEKDINVYYGVLNIINKNKCKSFSPILLAKNNKLIGVKEGLSLNNKFMNDIIKEFIEEAFLYKEYKIDKTIIEKIKKLQGENLNLKIMSIIYDIKDNIINRIALFGQKFVDNNDKKCYLIIDDELKLLEPFLELNENQKQKQKLEIKLVAYKPIIDLSEMFEECISLESLPDIDKWNTKNVIKMRSLFSGLNLLKSLPDISKWDTRNVEDMHSMFNKCKSLESLPDISKWDTSNVKDMGFMFSGCESLKSLPDIFKWDTKNVTSMGFMFCCCESLKSLPDISKWDTRNVTDMRLMFAKCLSLKSLPDISKWDTKNVIILDRMFFGCKLLESIPDISQWDTSNITYKEHMFYGCKDEIIEAVPYKFRDNCLII